MANNVYYCNIIALKDTMEQTKIYDVIIIGGSYAGLSAAMSLGRALRNVLIIDSGKPCNRNTPHAHNLITHDGDTPATIASKARDQVLAYTTVQLIGATAINVAGSNRSFSVTTETGAVFNGKKILLATGVKNIPKDIDGFAECWGISVLHCPYCHGYEVRNQALGVIANGDIGFEYLKLISNWTKNLTLLTDGSSTLNTEQYEMVTAKGIAVIEKKITAIMHTQGKMRSLLFEDGTERALTALFARSTTVQSTDIPVALGCELHDDGMFAGLIKIDDFGKTTVPGVYAAGDNTTQIRSLAAAIGSGSKTGAIINHELVAEEF